ncbi:hypothetical protein ABW19_dt0207510 [Dactylella cylindrospora]|nr:hypothetical protein ABW19_dt0207510 [Dactylella cylindrospora]
MLSNRDRDPFMPAVTQFYHQQHHQNHTLSLDSVFASSNSSTPSPARTPSRPRSLASPDSVPSTPVLKAWNATGTVLEEGVSVQKANVGRTIFINGYPGTGKLTVARELHFSKWDGCQKKNNMVLQFALSTSTQHISAQNTSDPEYQALRKAFRATLLDSIATAAPEHISTTWIFTECQSNSHIGTSISHEYLAAAQRRNSPFVSIILTCALEENLKRLSHPSRKTTPRRKLTNREVLKEIREQEVIHRFGDWIGVRELVVDVTKLEPEEAAVVIKSFLEKIAVEQAMGIPPPTRSSSSTSINGGEGSLGKRSGKKSRVGSMTSSREDVHMTGTSGSTTSSSSHGRTSIAALTSPTSTTSSNF